MTTTNGRASSVRAVKPTNDPLDFAPHSVEAEECTLGCILTDGYVINEVAGYLMPEQFFIERHGFIYAAALELYRRGDMIDTRTIAEQLRNTPFFNAQKGEDATNQLEAVGGDAYLAYLPTTIPTARHVDSYGRLVQRAALRRQLISVASDIAGLAYDGTRDIEQVLNAAQEAVFSVQVDDVRTSLVPFNNALQETFEWIEAQRNGTAAPEIPTPWKDLNPVLYGLGEKELLCIAGAPGQGKTAAMLQCATHAAKHDYRVLMFSLEMGERSLMQRIIAQETGISTQEQRKLPDAQWRKFLAWVNNESGVFDGLTLDCGTSKTNMQMIAKVRDFKRRHGLDLVVVDYLQLMTADGRHSNRNLELGAITRSLKMLAMELHIPVLIGSQISRDSRKAGRPPILHDLRDSGAIEQDIDKVVFVYDPDPPEEGIATNGPRQMIVGKHRNGPTGVIPVIWLGERIKFESAVKRAVNLGA
jgi:replicative DNA helicase